MKQTTILLLLILTLKSFGADPPTEQPQINPAELDHEEIITLEYPIHTCVPNFPKQIVTCFVRVGFLKTEFCPQFFKPNEIPTLKVSHTGG